ncbi:GNAT family N-acetyltransferase [Microbulbifer agarilyticus]|uniref:GNAT family N-acetyltransferase n=1 Tax=Microbulbifer agarilyticus TaxID=260552 RepID=UPI001C9690E9|nr:GNAT family N-acetyltransferase [Microbulbifer agarilyticus]MBY6210225.1 GNAT family N-acetyltransferase [Microbulbifer agarilyticus]
MDLTKTLQDPVVEISKLQVSDFDGLFRVANDKALWADHPAKDRYKRSEFEKWFESAMEYGCTLKIVDRTTGEIIGSTRYYDYQPGQEVAIGYTFLARKLWGGETNRRVKKLMFDYAFQHVERIWLHIGPDNIRSQKAAEKVGAVFSHSETKELAGSSLEYCCYRVDKSA